MYLPQHTPNFNNSRLSSSLLIVRKRSPFSGLVRISASISVVSIAWCTLSDKEVSAPDYYEIRICRGLGHVLLFAWAHLCCTPSEADGHSSVTFFTYTSRYRSTRPSIHLHQLVPQHSSKLSKIVASRSSSPGGQECYSALAWLGTVASLSLTGIPSMSLRSAANSHTARKGWMMQEWLLFPSPRMTSGCHRRTPPSSPLPYARHWSPTSCRDWSAPCRGARWASCTYPWVFTASDHQVVNMHTYSTLVCTDSFVEHTLVHSIARVPQIQKCTAKLVVPQLSAFHAPVQCFV